jgi:hypothetical protein
MLADYLKLYSMAVGEDPSLKPEEKSGKLYNLAENYRRNVMPWLTHETAKQNTEPSSEDLINLYKQYVGNKDTNG